jgi:hypothetical protein
MLAARDEEFRVASDPSCTLYPALRNPVTFPSFDDVTELEDPSTNYYTGWDEGCLVRSREWALLGEVTACEHFLRPRFALKTRTDEQFYLAFYPESPLLPGFDVAQVKVGHTFALLNAEKKRFMDMTSGVRLEQLDTCWAFKASLDELMHEAVALLAAADARARGRTPPCAVCGNAARSQCSRCKLAAFCSQECQSEA